MTMLYNYKNKPENEPFMLNTIYYIKHKNGKVIYDVEYKCAKPITALKRLAHELPQFSWITEKDIAEQAEGADLPRDCEGVITQCNEDGLWELTIDEIVSSYEWVEKTQKQPQKNGGKE